MTTPETPDRLAEIKARAEKATPGPWFWRGNTDNWSLRLSTTNRHGLTVMDFARWGMTKAAPRFPIDGLMHRADEMVRYEVAPDATDRKDPEVYRADVVGIRHPDAAFIAASRADVDYLLAEVERLRADVERLDVAWRTMRDERDTVSADLWDAAKERDAARAELANARGERAALWELVKRVVRYYSRQWAIASDHDACRVSTLEAAALLRDAEVKRLEAENVELRRSVELAEEAQSDAEVRAAKVGA